jgi:hypothetical protein
MKIGSTKRLKAIQNKHFNKNIRNFNKYNFKRPQKIFLISQIEPFFFRKKLLRELF